MASHKVPTMGDKNWKDVNILLLGESGVGKTTFINSFVNYVEYNDLDTALANEIMCLIPSSFSIPDENYKEQIVQVGSKNNNEDLVVGNSATQGTRSYVFPVSKDQRVRIIDTPGIGDVRGLEQDKVNFENILDYIGRFKHLHAICFLLKPDVTRLNVYFNFCIMHLLSRLDRSAVRNIIFVFTNTRKSFYRPGESLGILRKLLGEIEKNSGVVIACKKDNIFCCDNEAFRFLAAAKQSIHFRDSEKNDFAASWRNSSESCWQLLSYIMGDLKQSALMPHDIKSTLSVNSARRMIIDMSRPLADISDMIQDNLTVIDRHQQVLQTISLDVKTLKEQLYVPCVNLRQISLPQPTTVCTSAKCSASFTVMGMKKYHYKQRCHNPCYLENVPTELLGSPELRRCDAMKPSGECMKCGCNFQTHMHILYETELVEEKQVDPLIDNRIKSHEGAIREKNDLIVKLSQLSREYGVERDKISKMMAKFAFFLSEHSISTYNDAFLDYTDYLIDREKSLGAAKDQDVLLRLQNQKRQYLQEKEILDEAKQRLGNDNQGLISPSEIEKSVSQLCALKHSGKILTVLLKKQEKERDKQMEANTEYCHPKVIGGASKKKYEDDDLTDLYERLRDAGLANNSEVMDLIHQKIKEKSSNQKDENKETYDDRGNLDQERQNHQQEPTTEPMKNNQSYPRPQTDSCWQTKEMNGPRFLHQHPSRYYNDLNKNVNSNEKFNLNKFTAGLSNSYERGARRSRGDRYQNTRRTRVNNNRETSMKTDNASDSDNESINSTSTQESNRDRGSRYQNRGRNQFKNRGRGAYKRNNSDNEFVDNIQETDVASMMQKVLKHQEKRNSKKEETFFMYVRK